MTSKDLLNRTEQERLSLIQKIGAERNSFVISYLTSIRPGLEEAILTDDIQILEKHVRYAKVAGAANLDLMICTYGGHTAAPWDLMAMIRDYFPSGKVGVIPPGAAFSAGTMISLGADEIIAGPGTQLGPVDSSSGWDSPAWYDGRNSTSALQGFLDLVESTGQKDNIVRDRMMDWLTAQTDALALGEAFRTMRENRRLIDNIINTRQKPPIPRKQEELIHFFLHEVAFHNQAIRRREAVARGLDTITDIERSGVESEVIALFDCYTEAMKLHTPFARRTIDKRRRGDPSDIDAFGEHASETPIIIVESLCDTNAAFIAYGRRHWDNVPPIAPDEPHERKHSPAEKHYLGRRLSVEWSERAGDA